MNTLDRALAGLALLLIIVITSAWVSAPPRPFDGPGLEGGVARLCVEARGNASPDEVARLAAAPDVPALLGSAAFAYTQDPGAGTLQRLQQSCP